MTFSPSNITRTNIIHREQLTPFDTFALWITRLVGTIGCFGILFLCTLLWLIWNILAPPALRFDSCPKFDLLLFLSNILQIFLMPLLMSGQNLDARHNEARAEANFAVNIKAEQEIEHLLMRLDHHNQLLHDLIEQHEAQHREIMYRINQLDPRKSQLGIRHEFPTTIYKHLPSLETIHSTDAENHQKQEEKLFGLAT